MLERKEQYTVRRTGTSAFRDELSLVVSLKSLINVHFPDINSFQFYNVAFRAGSAALADNNRGDIFYVYNCTFIYDDESNPVGVIAGDV